MNETTKVTSFAKNYLNEERGEELRKLALAIVSIFIRRKKWNVKSRGKWL